MIALRALLGLVPWQAWALAGVLAVVGAWHWKEVRAAVAASYAAIVTKTNEADGKADTAQITVLECHAKGEGWSWNREGQKCEKR